MDIKKNAPGILAAAAALSLTGYLAYDAGASKQRSDDLNRETIEECTRRRGTSAALFASRNLLFLRESERLKIALTPEEIREIRFTTLSAITASPDARRWCKERVLSDDPSIVASRFIYPDASYDSGYISRSTMEKISKQMKQGNKNLFDNDKVDDWFSR